jgi:hypothetical protein
MPQRPGNFYKYSPSFIAKVDEYLELEKDREYEYHKTRGEKSDSFEEKISARLPTVEGFVRFAGLTKPTINKWRKAYPEFDEAIEKIIIEQKQRLINRGLDGTYSPVIAKLILSSNHGMREKIDATSNEETIGSFSEEQIDRIANRIAGRAAGDGGSPS